MNRIQGFFHRKRDRLTKDFTQNEFTNCYSHFRHVHNQKLNMPSADNNSLINFEQKLRNQLVMNSTIYMLFGGAGAYFVR